MEIETSELVRRWLASRDAERRAQTALATAQKELDKATALLGQRLVPIDICRDEKVGLWVKVDHKAEAILQVSIAPTSLGGARRYDITIRSTRPLDEGSLKNYGPPTQEG